MAGAYTGVRPMVVTPSPVRRIARSRRIVRGRGQFRAFRASRGVVARRLVFPRGPSAGAIARVAARRVLVRRALTGGVVAAGGLVGYGMYRGIRRFRRRRTARIAHVRNRRRIGERPGASRTKEKLTQNQADIPHASYTIHSHDCTNLGALDRLNIRERQHNDINLRGFRLNLRIRHNGLQPGVLTIMLVSFKNEAGVGNQPNIDFFKGRGVESDKNFDDPTLSGSDYVDLGYNKERMHCMYYKRLNLAPRFEYTAQSPYRNAARSNFLHIDQYIKMNRQLNFESDTATGVETPQRVYLLHWYAQPFTAATAQVSGQYSMSRKVSFIWREPNH